MTILVTEADKLTSGQILTVTAPHAVETLLRYVTGWWLTNATQTKYQAFFVKTLAINHTILLPYDN